MAKQKLNNAQVKAFDIESVSQDPALYAFGDSMTYGVGASDRLTTSYPAQLAALKGWSFTNVGDSGSKIADTTQLDVVYQKTITSNMNIVTLAGANDMTFGKTDLNKQRTYRNTLGAVLVWAAITDGYKIKGKNLSKTGTWTDLTTPDDGGIGTSSNTNGSTLTGTVQGTAVYIGNIVRDSTPGTFTVTIDGVSRGTFTTDEASIPARDVAPNLVYAGRLLRFTGLEDTTHSVVITVTSSTSSSNKVFIDYIAGNGLRNDGKSNVFVGNTLRLTSAGYSSKGTSESTVSSYGNVIREVVEMLAGDGLNVVLVDTHDAVDPATEFYDSQHPNDTGYTRIAEAFFNSMSSFIKAKDKTKANAGPGWRKPTLVSGWSDFDAGGAGAYGGPLYRKDALGMVHMTGLIKNTSGATKGTNSVLFTLDEGYRPARRTRIASDASDAFLELDVKDTGEVIMPSPMTLASNGWISMSNVHFLAEQ